MAANLPKGCVLQSKLQGELLPVVESEAELNEGPPPPLRLGLSPNHPHNVKATHRTTTTGSMIAGKPSSSYEVAPPADQAEAALKTVAATNLRDEGDNSDEGSVNSMKSGQRKTSPELQARMHEHQSLEEGGGYPVINSVDGTFMTMTSGEKAAWLEYIHLEPGKRRKQLALNIIRKQYEEKEWLPNVELPEDINAPGAGILVDDKESKLKYVAAPTAHPNIGNGGPSTFRCDDDPELRAALAERELRVEPKTIATTTSAHGGVPETKVSFTIQEIQQLQDAIKLSKSKRAATGSSVDQKDVALAVVLEELLQSRIQEAYSS